MLLYALVVKDLLELQPDYPMWPMELVCSPIG